jgi:hypothetical protein
MSKRPRCSSLALCVLAALPAAAQAQWTMIGNNIFYNTGNVAIGTTSPAYRLYVVSPGTSIVGATSAPSTVAVGVQGQSSSTLGRGVYGFATSSTGAAYGGLFRTLSNQGIGAFALADSATGPTIGIRGQSASTSGIGLSGFATATSGQTTGVRGQASSDEGTGVLGLATSGTGFTNGVYGESASVDGAGVFGFTRSGTGVNYGVYGETSNLNDGFGVYSVGDTGATGQKLFQIDHPIDPANQYLNHFSAEGPEPYLVYRGNVVLDQAGAAVVQLPRYFEAINRDITYQLTPIGAPASLYIAREVVNNQFAIAGGRPNQKVSWTVTGIRNDAFSRRHSRPAEQPKPPAQRGRFLHPEFVGAPADRAIRVSPAAPELAPGP